MNRIQKIAILYLIAMGFMAWGFMAGVNQIFPYQIYKNFRDFASGHKLGKHTSVMDKVMNDLGVEPRRQLREFPAVAWNGSKSIDVPGLKKRRENPTVFVAEDHREGYRVVFGALDFEQRFWGGLLLSPEGDLLHTWKLSTEQLPTRGVHDELSILYGLFVDRDGSVIFTLQEGGGGIVKFDGCGDVLWTLEGNYHHTITPADDGNFWTFEGMQDEFDHVLQKISQKTGEIVSSIDMADVRKANPFIHIFNLQAELEVKDISHGNDIEPLPAGIADRFDGFDAGDLLVSYRTHNLVFVLDPDTLKIKWWRIGPWDRQHDPDWESDGTITVFSNNMVTDRPYSDIVAINPATYETRILVDGEKFEFSSDTNGDHQLTDFGTRMITSSTQGWAFEVDQNGRIVFSFVNVYDTDKKSSLFLSEALRYPEDYFNEEFWKKCSE